MENMQEEITKTIDEKEGEIYKRMNENSQQLESNIDQFLRRQQDTIEQLQENLAVYKQNQEIFLEQQQAKMIGSFFYSARCEDDIGGAVKCNGQKISVETYPDFVNKFLKTGRIQSIPVDEWEKQKKNNGRVGFFGYDAEHNEFITPYIPAGIYLSNSLDAYMSEGKTITPNPGDFANDQIVNIRGNCNWTGGGQGHTEMTGFSGAFGPCSVVSTTYPKSSGFSIDFFFYPFSEIISQLL